jgi:hypothetical protein
MVKSGIVLCKYAGKQFDVSAYAMYILEDLKNGCTISLYTAVKQKSRSGEQGYVKCNCAGRKRCQKTAVHALRQT